MPKKTVKRPTICWKCRNAVPTATSGCSWSRDIVPVPGWVAEKHTTPHANDGGMITAYCVDYCPEFQKDSKVPEQICKNDEACTRLAVIILQKQMERYRQALDQYARTRKGKFLGQIRDIERELLTPYYAALSLHTVDIRAVCNELRQKAGMPKLEEMQ